MKRKCIFLPLLALLMMSSLAHAQHPQHLFYRPIILSEVNQDPTPLPPIHPFSLTDPLPCDIEAYQSEVGIDIIANDVALSGYYQISVFDHHLDRVYNANVLLYDGATAFISTNNWPEDTYYLQIIIPGGWLEGEFEIE